MDIAAILALIEKGVAVISTAISIGASAAPAIKVIEDLIAGAKSGTVTDEELAAAELALDAMIDDFNTPL